MLKRSDLEGLRDELQSPPDPTHWLVLKSEMADYLTAMIDRWPEGHVLVPGELTAENGAKTALIGEFLVVDDVPCPECASDDDDCHVCDGIGEVVHAMHVPWPTIKKIHKAVVAHFAAQEAPDDRG